MRKNKECCTILGEKLDSSKNWVTNVRKNGKEWIPMFLEYVDSEKCIGCGLCVKICTGRCYEMKVINPVRDFKGRGRIQRKQISNGVNGKKVAVAVNPENCLGDCSCHLICPVQGGAMVCKPRIKSLS